MPEERMVLRTVYLPPELDAELRKIAYDDGRTKGDLIRDSIRAWVQARQREVATER